MVAPCGILGVAIFGVVGPVGLVIVFLVLLLLFGHRLPAAMRGLGGSVSEFKKGLEETDNENQDHQDDKSPDARGR